MYVSHTSPILVTGASGLIGSTIIWQLNKMGYERIIACDVMGTDDRWKNIVGLHVSDYLEADDLFTAITAGRLKSLECVFHMGACSATTERDVSYLMKNNFDFTRKLAEWSLANGTRFVYASSAATYGDASAQMDDSHDNIKNCRPLNAYGYSKQLFDVYALSKDLLNRIVGLKFFNVFGPNENHKGDMRSVVYKAYHQIKSERSVNLFKSYRPEIANGYQQRDFLYVKDAAMMAIHLCFSEHSGIFNLGSGTASTWIDLVTPIFESLGLEPKINFVEMPDQLRNTYQYFTKANTSKLSGAGWGGCRYTLKEAVTDYVLNYLEKDCRLDLSSETIGD